MSSYISSRQRKRQQSEQQTQGPLPKRQNLAPQTAASTHYWDLSKIWLTKNALAELGRRNKFKVSDRPNPPPIRHKPTRDPLPSFAPKYIKAIKRFSRAGGPDLSDLRDYARPIYESMSPNRSISSGMVSSGRKQSTKLSPPNTRGTKSTMKMTGTSVYSHNFEQKLIDHGFYPDEYEYPDGRIPQMPNNWKDINERLARSRAFLSPSRFNNDDFRKFKRAEMHTSKENPVMSSVIPIIEGDNGDLKCVAGGYPLGNLIPLIKLQPSELDGNKPELAPATPDRFYGALPKQLNQQIRDELYGQIVPSTQDNLPMLPNFFLEAKGPDGSLAVATRQACYDGALGARGMHALQSYEQKEAIYDRNAYTITSIYHGGTLKLYTHHIIPSEQEGRESECIMTQLEGYAMTGNQEAFVRGVSAYRNLRDWAKEQRDELITGANERYLKRQSKNQSTPEHETTETTSELIATVDDTVDDTETSTVSDEVEFPHLKRIPKKTLVGEGSNIEGRNGPLPN